MLSEILQILRNTKATDYIREGRGVVLFLRPSLREEQMQFLIQTLEKLHADSKTNDRPE